MMKTTLRSNNIIYHACSLPIDIFNDKMVKVMLPMVSDVVNYGCLPIFLTTSPRIPNQGLEGTSWGVEHMDTKNLKNDL